MTLHNLYIGYYIEHLLGRNLGASAFNNCNEYIEDNHLGYAYDKEDEDIGPVGIKVFPPDDIHPQSLTWTFDNLLDAVNLRQFANEEAIYDRLSSGNIFKATCGTERNFRQMLISFGPIASMAVGDTLHFMVGQVYGKDFESMFKNVERLEGLKLQNFEFPGPPPSPEVSFIRGNHQITLQWKEDPEIWTDERRADRATVPQPFEGYRVYKSTISINGPWTLLAEFDIDGNEFFNNSGLQHKYADIGLVNNIEYWYSVTSFSKPDTISKFISLESSINASAIEATAGPAAPESVGKVAVVPNPYRGDVSYHEYKPPWENPSSGIGRWIEQDRRIQFINLPTPCEIIIYTSAGDLVRTIQHTDPTCGFADWNLTSTVGQTVASGIYLFSVEDRKNGKIQTGKFVIIK
jgi:hypothetical protein